MHAARAPLPCAPRALRLRLALPDVIWWFGKSGNWEIWWFGKFGNLVVREIRKFGGSGNWEIGKLGSQNLGTSPRGLNVTPRRGH